MAVSARGDDQPPDGAKTWQRFPPEAETADVQQVRPVDLGRGVAREGKGQVVGRHAAAIIRDPDQRLAAIGDVDLDSACSGVQRVFNQFLHRRGGTFHNLTRCNAVDRNLIQLADHRAACSARYLGGMNGHMTICSSLP